MKVMAPLQLVAAFMAMPCIVQAGVRKIYEPVKEEVEPHKYIWDGQEYDRMPNLFKIHDEVLMLPDVESVLDFEPAAFAEAGDTFAEKELRSSRPWGRLYLEGWPNSIQYMRATSGVAPPQEKLTFIRADSPTGCTDPADGSVKGKVVVVQRGECTFGGKAKRMEEAGALGVIYVNNEDGNHHPPTPDYPEANIFLAMVAQDLGTALLKWLGSSELEGWAIPIHCGSHGLEEERGIHCIATSASERSLIAAMPDGGVLHTGDHTFEYIMATFGARPVKEPLIIANPEPHLACEEPENAEHLAGKAVVLPRGGCSFGDKALHLANAGVAAMILVNEDAHLVKPGVAHTWMTAHITFPVVSVTKEAGGILEAALGSTVTFDQSFHQAGPLWIELTRLKDPSAWPHNAEELYRGLQEKHAMHRERLAALEQTWAVISEQRGDGLDVDSTMAHPDPEVGSCIGELSTASSLP
ncbi:unnamed protein product [Chrysoparadoxa australica]